MARYYIHSILAACGIFSASYLIGAALEHAGMHPQETLLNDALLGLFAGLGLFFSLRYREAVSELRRRRQHERAIARLNHHVRNALQLIVNRTEMEAHSASELHDIRLAVNRIDWALREILPHVNLNPEPERTGYPEKAESPGSPPGSGNLYQFRKGTDRSGPPEPATPKSQTGDKPGPKISVTE